MSAAYRIRGRRKSRRTTPGAAALAAGLAWFCQPAASAFAQGLPSDPGLTDSEVSSPNSITAGGLRGMQGDDASSSSQGSETAASASVSPTTSDATPASEANLRSMSIPAVSGTASPDYRPDFARLNLRQKPIRGRVVPTPPEPLDQGPGIRFGSFILRPELRQSVGAESQTYSDGSHSHRTYAQTEIRGSLTSDWSRNALTINASGTDQKNISGSGETEPTASVDADLRLDLARGTTADLTAGYNFYRESITDPNAIADARTQAAVNTFTGGAAISRDAGLINGSLSARAIRTTYGDVQLSDGSTASESDRNTTSGELTARVGYHLSGVLNPFLQTKYLRTSYDADVDSSGFRRSSNTYTAQVGVAADFGEKLSGELAAGYVLRQYQDSRLPDVDGLALDATGHWSPHRGTDVAMTFATQIEDSTTPAVSGAVDYVAGTTLTQQLRDDVVAKLTAQYLYRDYRQNALVPDEQVYSASGGLSWYLSPYLSLDGTVSYAKTRQKGSHDENVATVDVGLTVRR